MIHKLMFRYLLSLALAVSAMAAEFIPDIEYGVADGERLRLDISIPDGEGPFPVAMLVHGGGWGSGDKSGAEKPNSGADITPWFQPLTDAGFVWVSINYRLSPPHRWPGCKEDTLAALAWINQHIAEYHGDPDRIAVFGHSAGGQLAMFTAMADEAIRPEAIVGCAAASSFEQDLEKRGGLGTALQNLFDQPKEVTPESLAILRSTSPLNLLEPDLPAFLLIHGDADQTVPIEQSLDIQQRLLVLNTPCDLLMLPGAPHRLTEWNNYDPEWQAKMVQWLRATLDHKPVSADLFFSISDDALQLLPKPDDLPTASGKSKRLFTRTGANMEMGWQERRLHTAIVTSTSGKPIQIEYEDRAITLQGEVGVRWTLDADLNIVSQEQAFNAYVATDGSGQYDSLQRAIVKCPADLSQDKQWIIQVAPGTYRERLYIQREKRFVTLRGYKPSDTIVTFDLNANMIGADGDKLGTFRTPTVVLDSDDFTMENITIENAAGPVGQALAIHINGDRCIFRNCRFLGWQDTVFANRGRQYFENCYIEGHVDYIFGGATCFFQNCHLHSLGDGYITAASTPENQPYGFVFKTCYITASNAEVKTYLGRPWRPFAAVTFIDTYMGPNVREEGWNNWGKPERETTSRYFEFNSYGPGTSPDKRVPWANKTTTASQQLLTPKDVLSGTDGWNPASR